MGMPFGIDVRSAPADPAPVLARCFGLLRHIDDVFSRWRRGTPMARYAAGIAVLDDLAPEITGVLALAHRARQATGGWFHPHRPDGTPEVDGIVKGWAVARVADVLDGAGLRDWCVNAAGDVYVSGAPEPGRRWRIGIADPRDPSAVVAVVTAGDRTAVATSGIAERGGHIWNPHTGRAAAALLSVSVRTADPLRADVLATAAIARGPSCTTWLDAIPGVAALAVHPDGHTTTTRTWGAPPGRSRPGGDHAG